MWPAPGIAWKRLGSGAAVEHAAALLERDDLVAVAVEDEERHRQAGDLRLVVIARADEGPEREERVDRPRHGGDRGEGRLEDERAAGPGEREVKGHGRAERLSEDHEPFLRDALLLDQPPVRGTGVPVGALLVGRALAPPVAPVVEEEHRGPELRLQEERAIQAVADVAPVAVGEEHGPPRLARGRQVPGVDPHPVLGREREVLEGEAQVARQ